MPPRKTAYASHLSDGNKPTQKRSIFRKSTSVNYEDTYLDLPRDSSSGSLQHLTRHSKPFAHYLCDPDILPSEGPRRKAQLFDWDDMGLGLEMEVSSGTTSGSEQSLLKQPTRFPSKVPVRHLSRSSPKPLANSSFTANHDKEGASFSYTPQPTSEWVGNLVELRKFRGSAKESDVSSSAVREWLLEQHRALDAHTIPVTLKCILAASGVSSRFNKCRNDFLKPEYRSRYWSWSENFISLLDFYIYHGHVKVSHNSGESKASNQKLKLFIQTSQVQKNQGRLSDHREKLLSAIGIKWQDGDSKNDSEDEGQDEDEGEEEDCSSGADETWEMPSKDNNRKSERLQKKLDARKRQRSKSIDTLKEPQPSIVGRLKPPVQQSRRSMLQWAKRIVEIREYFRKGNTYDIPADRPYLLIWMNAEIARSSTGTLSIMCCAILKAAKLVDAISVSIDASSEKWCKAYMEFLDFHMDLERSNASVKRAPQRITDFLYDCREAVIDCELSDERAALLKAVDDGWLQSKLMEISIARNGNKPQPRKYSGGDGNLLSGHVVEVVLDSGKNTDESVHSKKKRKKSNTLCKQMVSSMIKGIVGESIEGRPRTDAERDAEEWVSRAGAKALNNYARNWFRTATVD